MIKFNKPKNLNGAELRIELSDDGIQLNGWIDGTPDMYVIDNNLFLNVDESLKQKTEFIVEKHNGTTVAVEPTIEQKLASVGLSLDDLKSALGL